MEQKIDIWDEFNEPEDKDMPTYVLNDLKLVFSQYEHKLYELKDGWLFKLSNPYFLTKTDEKAVLKHCQQRDKFNYILMKVLDGKEGLQRPRVQEMENGRLSTRRL